MFGSVGENRILTKGQLRDFDFDNSNNAFSRKFRETLTQVVAIRVYKTGSAGTPLFPARAAHHRSGAVAMNDAKGAIAIGDDPMGTSSMDDDPDLDELLSFLAHGEIASRPVAHKLDHVRATLIVRECAASNDGPARARSLLSQDAHLLVVSSKRFEALRTRRFFQPGVLLLVDDAAPAFDDDELDEYMDDIPKGVYARWSGWDGRSGTEVERRNLNWNKAHADEEAKLKIEHVGYERVLRPFARFCMHLALSCTSCARRVRGECVVPIQDLGCIMGVVSPHLMMSAFCAWCAGHVHGEFAALDMSSCTNSFRRMILPSRKWPPPIRGRTKVPDLLRRAKRSINFSVLLF